MVCNLLLGQSQRDVEYVSFSKVLRTSLSVEKTTPAFCETCKKFTPTNQYARVTELPQILSINCGLTNEKEMNFLRKQMNRNTATASTETNTAPISSTPIKPCRYGANCSRVDCHFAHSDRRSPAVNTTNGSNLNTTTSSTGNNRSSIWFPHHFTMEIDGESNELKITSAIDEESNSRIKAETESSITTESTAEDLSVSELKLNEESSTVESEQSEEKPVSNKRMYKLTAVVCQIINGNQKNLVALIRVGDHYHKAKLAEFNSNTGQWYIFNDFR